MYEVGENVVHPRYGSGTVTEIRKFTVEGEEKRYVCIELVGDGGTAMIPISYLDDAGIREANTDLELVETIMGKVPNELQDDYRKRQSEIERKLKNGNFRKMVQALRDLAYRERVNKLSQGDMRLKDRLLTKIVHELSLNPRYKIASLKEKVQRITILAMDTHTADQQEAAESA